MKFSDLLIAMAATGLLFFVAFGVASRLMPIDIALASAVAAWIGAAYLFVRTMQRKPAPQRS